jgi:predicted Zn-dependent protease
MSPRLGAACPGRDANAALAQSIIRDAEIERALRELAAPVFREAGLPQSTRVIIINDGSMNAFVADARHVFLHSGLLLRLEAPTRCRRCWPMRPRISPTAT